jgi:hypothetical protein
VERAPNDPDRPPRDELPFPESLCHRCGAPPRYLRGKATWFVWCPRIPERYPRQPVLVCSWFVPDARANPHPQPPAQ